MSKIIIDENKIKHIVQNDPFMDKIKYNEKHKQNVETKNKNETIINKIDCENIELYNKLNEVSNTINYLLSEIKILKANLNKKNINLELQIKKQNKILNDILNIIDKKNKKLSILKRVLNFLIR